MKFESAFLWVSCNEGFEGALKTSLLRAHPEFRSAFQLPGLVTFKAPHLLPLNFVPETPFARQWGLSFLKTSDPIPVIEECEKKFKNLVVHAWRVNAPKLQSPPLPAALEDRLVKARSTPAVGDFVLDLIYVTTAQGSQWWIGGHEHTREHAPWAGGGFDLSRLSEQAPSRAYLKAIEAYERFNLPVAPGDSVFEIGCAPGGMSHFFLGRECSVTGVDAGEMDPGVLKAPGFTHLKRAISQIKIEDLPSPCHWLIIDMNAPPAKVIEQTKRFFLKLSRELKGVVIQFKMNSQASVTSKTLEFAHARKILSRELGLKQTWVRQLTANSKEVSFVGLR